MLSGEMKPVYDPKEVEDKWYEFWEKGGFFHQEADDTREKFCIVMPPPNVTGQLHMGHAMDNTLQDILTRYKRMRGYNTLWLPGTDHAGIATQAKVEESLREENLTRYDLGREGFLARTFAWKDKYHDRIVGQLRRMGASADWDRERFTMDEGLSRAVREAFVRYYEQGLIYRGKYIVNWCPHCHTTISDIEVEHNEREGHLWEIRYPIKGEDGCFLTVATTRPETMLGDTALAVNPNDERYRGYVGKTAVLPILGREIPVIADEYVEMEFGTGVVKITPFHDPNDFEVGLRHHLPQIEVIDLDAKMTAAAGKYEGMDRYECRKAVVADLAELGMGGKTTPHLHAVGECYRCGTTVEPLISPQWFLKMKPLAEPAIQAVKKGDTRFVPERFDKVYLNWMENIRDWCISRQLWWGHRIPVWYCDACEKEICQREEPTVCPDCGGSLRQDEDVLDTWFSSALWPFSTLGWPEKTEDFSRFFPTSVLVTGRDIIFFWVARMIFSALAMVDDVPFREVLIHGLILDEKGRKMSKSLNNGIDPLEIIADYGADSLRFMLITGNTPGNDLRFQRDRLEGSRNFANKIWNASRFVLMNLEGDLDDGLQLDDLALHDRWILTKLQLVARKTSENMEKYELGDAAHGLYEFIWNDFCDWYLELSKNSLYKGTEKEKKQTRQILVYVLQSAMEMLHPFMPHITEEIWQRLPHQGETVMLASYPVEREDYIFDQEVREMEKLLSLIRVVRNLRAEMKVPLGQKANLEIAAREEDKASIEAARAYLEKAAAVEAITFLPFDAPAPKGAAAGVLEEIRVYLPLAGLIDMEKEKARLIKERDNMTKEIRRLEGKLNNPGFLGKAPEEVVAGERVKLAAAEKKCAGLEETLKIFN